MNERIKEVANQMFSMEQFEYAEEFLDDEFMEKFAELIVKECAQVGFEAVSNGDLVEDSILTHFGVE
jgi:hypothetical protein